MSLKQFIEDNNVKHIYVDIDGVLWHSCQAIVDILNEMQDTDFSGKDVKSWNFKEICPDITEETVENLFTDISFFHHVKWIDGAIDFLKQYRNKIIIVTKAKTDNYIYKRQFFDDCGLEDIPIIPLPLNISKGIIDMSDGIFIDDSTKNLNESNAMYKIQFREYFDGNENREWIKDWNGLIMYNWE